MSEMTRFCFIAAVDEFIYGVRTKRALKSVHNACAPALTATRRTTETAAVDKLCSRARSRKLSATADYIIADGLVHFSR